jgi:hypothetical protein
MKIHLFQENRNLCWLVLSLAMRYINSHVLSIIYSYYFFLFRGFLLLNAASIEADSGRCEV